MSQVGNKTTVNYCAVGPSGSYTKLAHAVDATIPEISMGKIEATEYDSPEDHLAYVPGEWIDSGDVELELNYEAANAETVYNQFGIDQYWKILLKDGSYWRFPGFLSKLGGAIPSKGIVTQKATIAATGKINFVKP